MSADLPLGIPFNIVQYSLLTHLIAHVCGMVPEEFVWVGGDTHVYSNQLNPLEKQLERQPLKDNGAILTLNPAITTIDQFTYQDITVEGYQSHPSVKFPTAAV